MHLSFWKRPMHSTKVLYSILVWSLFCVGDSMMMLLEQCLLFASCLKLCFEAVCLNREVLSTILVLHFVFDSVLWWNIMYNIYLHLVFYFDEGLSTILFFCLICFISAFYTLSIAFPFCGWSVLVIKS